jgi:small subunit ribosomal protein S16
LAVRIRMKKMGRTHRPFFRVCAMDSRTPRNGRVIEELGFYDPMVKEADARAVLNGERIDYWLSVGAKPTPKVGTLIKKYGSGGTHLEAQAEALQRIQANKPTAPAPVIVKVKVPESETPAEGEATAEGEAPAAEEAASEEQTEAKTEE